MWKFKPILKQTLWGGEHIASFKHIKEAGERIGESWELSAVPGSVSVIAEGTHCGETLLQLLDAMREALVGKSVYKHYGNEFPLLFKFIDAKLDLSVQVHPDDEMAWRLHGKHGKSEMWYVLKSDDHAHLCSGFACHITPEEYVRRVAEDTIVEVLQDYRIQEGDVFYLPAGRIHSIGAGSFVAEIQQSSDVTYRVYDFKRRDADGNYRELHTDLAQKALNYEVCTDYRTAYKPQKDVCVPLVHSSYFTTSLYDLTQPMTIDYATLDSFVVWMVLEGTCRVLSGSESMSLQAGETLLLPATAGEVWVIPGETVKFLETKIEE